MRGSWRLLVLISVAFVNWDCATPQDRERAADMKATKRAAKMPNGGASEANPEQIGKIVGRTADQPQLAGNPLLTGGIVALCPVSPEGAAGSYQTTHASGRVVWGAQPGHVTREVAIFVQYTPLLDLNPSAIQGPPAQGQEIKNGQTTTTYGFNSAEHDRRCIMTLLPLAPPRSAAITAEAFPPELNSNTFNTLKRTRQESPNYRKIDAAIEGVPHWWVLSPGWVSSAIDPNPALFLAELYSSDPDGGAAPVDVAVVARRTGEASWQPTSNYLLRGDRLMRATAVIENGLPSRVDAAEVLEPPVEDFLVSKETSIPCARLRTGVLLTVKNRTLPRVLQEGKTSSLTDVATRVEKTILDLNYNREQANNLAQKAIESGGNPGGLPDLSLAYKERVEVLKAVLAAIKEEIANRGK